MMPHDISVRSKGQYSLIKHSIYSFEGARNLMECSNRGLCDYSTGKCSCYAGFRASDGFNGNGTIPDCGYRYAHSNAYVQSGVTKYTSCPVDSSNLVCSGNGVCDESKGTCTCSSGYGRRQFLVKLFSARCYCGCCKHFSCHRCVGLFSAHVLVVLRLVRQCGRRAPVCRPFWPGRVRRRRQVRHGHGKVHVSRIEGFLYFHHSNRC